MQYFALPFLALCGTLARAAPTKVVGGSLVGDVLSALESEPAAVTTAVGYGATLIVDQLEQITPTVHPSQPEEGLSALQSIFALEPKPSNLYAAIGEVVAAGLTTGNVGDLIAGVEGLVEDPNSLNNNNPRQPVFPIYPKASYQDAPYDLSEEALRAAIYIPPTFQYGRMGAPQPIVLVPGTGNTGYETFEGNYIPLLQGSKIADPVWLNIPGQLLNDAQTSAEYVAYAINYIFSITGCKKIAVLAWSQGNINAQWAYKYWPSTRGRVTDHIAFSPDYHGTVIANFAALPGEPLPPSVLQQEYNSKFITTLRANGGDSAYVTTTTVYSGFFDEIVEPQQGTGASAFLLDARSVGVTNNEVQIVCKDQPAGGFYTHEGILYNNLGFALAIDALSHDGPGRTERLNLPQVCALPISQGLDITDFLLTENAIAISGVSILTYPTPVFTEPPIKSYALTGKR